MENEKNTQLNNVNSSLDSTLLSDMNKEQKNDVVSKINEASIPSENINVNDTEGKTLSDILKSNERNDAILSVRNLHVSFKTDEGLVHAVRGVSFDLYKGETLCIVGESGCGKSVTSKTIMGILSSSAVIEEGSVMYEGEDLTKIDESEFHRIRGHKIGMIFQDPLSSLNPIMKVGKQITEAMLVNANHLKKMKDSHIAKEQAEYKNNKVRRNIVYSKVNRAIEVSDEEFNKQLYALEVKLNEAKYALDLTKKDSDEYNSALENYNSVKSFVKNESKKIKVLKKQEHNRIAKEGRTEELAADKEYKANKPTLKLALSKKKKEADALIKKYKEDNTKIYLDDIAQLKFEKEQKIKDGDLEGAKEIDNKIKQRKIDYKALFRISRAQAKEAALKVMKEVGIPQPEERFKQYPFEFSGGMRQRIVIAIALTANPDILICDEPTTALDVTIQAQILELINKLKAERNMSIIFITHDLGVVANMADRVAVMYAGKIVEVGNVNEIFYDPKHPYTWALLSSIPDIDSKEKLEAIPGTPPYLLNPPKGDAFAARNKYAMSIDFEQEPPFFKVSPTHYAATWLLDGRAPKTEKPKIVSQRIKVSLERAGVKDE